MQQVHRFRRRLRKERSRRGVVAVEFAVVAPLFVVLLLGMIETSRLYDIQSQLSSALREGARLAAMDRNGMLADGQSTNDKVVEDIRNFLNANGLPGNDVGVIIADADDPGVPFDLDDPANDLQLFQLRLEVPYSAFDPLIPAELDSMAFSAKVVFRNARAIIVQ